MSRKGSTGGKTVTEKSKLNEELHNDTTLQVFKECGNGLELYKKLPYDVLKGARPIIYARTKMGKPTTVNADGGMFVKSGVSPLSENIIGVAEHKHQDKPLNAVERASRYFMKFPMLRIEPWRLFVSTSGQAFVKGTGGQALAVLEDFMDVGVTYTVNATYEELRVALTAWMQRLVNE